MDVINLFYSFGRKVLSGHSGLEVMLIFTKFETRNRECEGMIGKVERVPLKHIWKHEAYDFTNWLAENLDVLSDALGISLSLVQTEKSVGTFNVDILAEDSTGNSVIIENQLEKTDHDHLGKLITYATNLEAKVAIWISSNPRPEHITAISWLNESTPIDFYLLKVEAIKIGDSEPAPLFYIIAGPSEESKDIGTEKKELAKRHHKRLAFWESLLSKSKEKTKLFSNVSPSKESWISTGVGLTGLSLNYVVTYDWGAVELYIDKGKDSESINKERFDYLFSKKEVIEKELGEQLIWERLDNKRASRIRKKFDGVGLRDEERWDDLQHKMIDFMIRFEGTLKKYIPELRRIESSR